jgi:hypothetical protein
LLHRLASIESFGRAARVVLALLLLFAMSAPLMHVHAAHDCSTETRSAAADVGVAADDHGDQRPSGHPAGGLDCCVHPGSVVSPVASTPLVVRYDHTSSRIAVPDDLVLDASPTNRLERPPRNLLST